MLFLVTRSFYSTEVIVTPVRNFPFPCSTHFHVYHLPELNCLLGQCSFQHLSETINFLLTSTECVDSIWLQAPSSVREDFFQVAFSNKTRSLSIKHLTTLPEGTILDEVVVGNNTTSKVITCTQATLGTGIKLLLGLQDNDKSLYESSYQYTKPWWCADIFFNTSYKALITLDENGLEAELLLSDDNYKVLPINEFYFNRKKTVITTCCWLNHIPEHSLLLQKVYSGQCIINCLVNKSHLIKIEIIKQRKFPACAKELLLSQRKNDFYNYSNWEGASNNEGTK